MRIPDASVNRATLIGLRSSASLILLLVISLVLVRPEPPSYRALVVTGLGGDLTHAAEYAASGSATVEALRSIGYNDAVRFLLEDGRFPGAASGADAARLSGLRLPDGPARLETIEAALQEASAADQAGDVLLLVLSGHADVSASSARPADRGKWRLHLPGPDLDSEKLRSLVSQYPGTVILIAATPHAGSLGRALEGTRCVLVTLCRANQGNMLASPSVLAPAFSASKGFPIARFTETLRAAVTTWYKSNNFAQAESQDLNGDTSLFQTPLTGAAAASWSTRAVAVADTTDPFSSAFEAATTIASHAPDADAVVLFRMIDLTMDEEGNITERRREVVRVQSARARDAGDITFISGTEDDTWTLVRAEVRRNGNAADTVIRIGKDAIFENPMAMPAEMMLKTAPRSVTIHPPGMEVGSISDIEYVRRERTFSVNAEPGIDWPLMDLRPVTRLLVRVTVPKRMKLSIAGRRLPLLKETEDRYSRTYSVAVENMPGISFEPMAPPLEEIVPRLIIAKKQTWEEIGRWYSRLSEGARLPDSGVAKAIGQVDTAHVESDLYDWVCRSIRYVFVPLGAHSYKPSLPAGTVRRGFGDCKDKASLLVSALASHGRRAHIVLIGAGRGDVVEEVPRPGAFNHAIVAIPGAEGYLFTDPTSEVAEYGTLPNMDEGRLALVIFDDSGALVRTPVSPPEKNRVDIERRAIQDNGALVVSETRILTGQAAFQSRQALRSGSPDQHRSSLGQQIASRHAGAVLLDYANENSDSATAPFREFLRYRIPLAGGLLPIPFSGMILPPPPRRLPIQLPSTMLLAETTYLDRTGFETSVVPAGAAASNSAGEVRTTYEELAATDGGTGFLVARRVLRLPQRDMPADTYEDFLALVAPAPVFLGARIMEQAATNWGLIISGLAAAAILGAVLATLLNRKRRTT